MTDNTKQPLSDKEDLSKATGISIDDESYLMAGVAYTPLAMKNFAYKQIQTTLADKEKEVEELKLQLGLSDIEVKHVKKLLESCEQALTSRDEAIEGYKEVIKGLQRDKERIVRAGENMKVYIEQVNNECIERIEAFGKVDAEYLSEVSENTLEEGKMLLKQWKEARG